MLEEHLELLVERVLRRVLRDELHPELLTPAQAGELAGGLSAKTICGWVRAGKLKRYGEGRPLVSRKELLELLSEPRARARPLERVPSAEAEVRRLTRAG